MTIQELEQFIATYGTDIYSFCVYLTGNRPEAEELYQDTFLKTLELLDKIQKDGNPKSYLLSVAIRIWKNRNRKINCRNSIAPMESEEPMEPAAGGNGERGTIRSGRSSVKKGRNQVCTDNVAEIAGEVSDSRVPVLRGRTDDRGYRRVPSDSTGNSKEQIT